MCVRCVGCDNLLGRGAFISFCDCSVLVDSWTRCLIFVSCLLCPDLLSGKILRLKPDLSELLTVKHFKQIKPEHEMICQSLRSDRAMVLAVVVEISPNVFRVRSITMKMCRTIHPRRFGKEKDRRGMPMMDWTELEAKNNKQMINGVEFPIVPTEYYETRFLFHLLSCSILSCSYVYFYCCFQSIRNDEDPRSKSASAPEPSPNKGAKKPTSKEAKEEESDEDAPLGMSFDFVNCVFSLFCVLFCP